MDITLRLIENIGSGTRLTTITGQLAGKSPTKVIVPINSYGGDMLEAFSIYNYLRGFDFDIEAKIIGYALSAGTIVSAGAKTVEMSSAGYYMIHNPWGLGIGDAREMGATTELLGKATDAIADIYVRKTGMDKSKILQMMDSETWLLPQEALEMGFIDRIVEGSRIDLPVSDEVHGFIFNSYKNVPENLKNSIEQKHNKMEKNFFDKIKAAIKAKFGIDASSEDELIAAISADDRFSGFENQVSGLVNQITAVQKQLSELNSLTAGHAEAIVNESKANTDFHEAQADKFEAVETQIGGLKDVVKALQDTVAEQKQTLANGKFPDMTKAEKVFSSAMKIKNPSKY